jgi:hypothetical protein
VPPWPAFPVLIQIARAKVAVKVAAQVVFGCARIPVTTPV